jgi:hypothetical protein
MRITGGDDAGRILEVAGELPLGRRQDGPGKIRDLEVSRLHARVWLDADGGLTVEDAGSTNGTFVNGERIAGPRALTPGDTVRLGQTTLEVEAPPAAEPEPEPAAPPEPEPVVEPAASPEPVVEPEPEPEPAASSEPAAPPRPAGDIPRPLVYVLLGVFLLAAAGIAAVVILTGDDGDGSSPRVQGPPALVSSATEAGCTAQDLESEGDRTVTGEVRYRSDPPHSGDHWEKPASDGIWETPPPLPKIVRSLHLGRIVLWHKPGDEKAYRLMREVGDESARHMLLVPNPTMRHRVAATAWGHLLACGTINGSTAGAVRAFRDAYRDKGPDFEP